MLRLNGKFNIDASVVRGDKSVSHRALIFASVAKGQSVIRNLTLSEDILATVDCLRSLGATVVLDGNTAIVTPITSPNENTVLNCKNSGTTARLLAGLVAGLGVKARFIGDGSLSTRPMRRVLDPLTRLGANFRQTDGCLFESLGGKLHGATIVAEVNSAQVKSAVLIAGLFAEGETTYVERIPTRNHTELMLLNLGADIELGYLTATVKKSTVEPLNLDVPNDPSSFAFLVGLSLITSKQISCKNMLGNEYRFGFFRTLILAGANIEIDAVREEMSEQIIDFTVKNSHLKPLIADPVDVCDGIDELPMLAAVSLTIEGKHVFASVSELQNKESDRVKAIVNMAEACGQRAYFDGENLTIESDGKLSKNPHFVSYNDHRIAMAQTVLCCACGGGTVDETPFDVSFPEFLQALGINVCKLGLIGESIANSRSPLLMEHLATQANATCSYCLEQLPADISDDDLLKIISKYDGLNVTMPFKTRVARLLGSKCASVNTVGKNVLPQSTDGYGIEKALQGCNVEFANKPLWIVGAGGAAETCIETLLKYGCKMQVLNRTSSHADELTAKYDLSTDITAPYGVLSFIPECEFEQGIVLPNSCKFVFVAAYKGKSGLKNQALARGITYVDGLRMLYHQGAKSFSLWTNTPLLDDYNEFERFLIRNDVHRNA